MLRTLGVPLVQGVYFTEKNLITKHNGITPSKVPISLLTCVI
jgi:hypothetical protein